MSAKNDIRTTWMHRMARRAVWRLFMNSRKGLKRGCPRYNNMVKEKANSIRIYDSEGYRRRAACICVKNDLEDEVSQPADGSFWYFCSRHVDRALVFSSSRKRLFFSCKERPAKSSLDQPIELDLSTSTNRAWILSRSYLISYSFSMDCRYY